MLHHKKIWMIVWLAIFLAACSANATEAPVAPSSITGRIFFDTNADTECQDCECGLSNIHVELYTGECYGPEYQTIKSDQEGYFTFNDVAPGQYCVVSALDITCDGYIPTSATSQEIEVLPGQQIEIEWFSYDLYIDTNG